MVAGTVEPSSPPHLEQPIVTSQGVLSDELSKIAISLTPYSDLAKLEEKNKQQRTTNSDLIEIQPSDQSHVEIRPCDKVVLQGKEGILGINENTQPSKGSELPGKNNSEATVALSESCNTLIVHSGERKKMKSGDMHSPSDSRTSHGQDFVKANGQSQKDNKQGRSAEENICGRRGSLLLETANKVTLNNSELAEALEKEKISFQIRPSDQEVLKIQPLDVSLNEREKLMDMHMGPDKKKQPGASVDANKTKEISCCQESKIQTSDLQIKIQPSDLTLKGKEDGFSGLKNWIGPGTLGFEFFKGPNIQGTSTDGLSLYEVGPEFISSSNSAGSVLFENKVTAPLEGPELDVDLMGPFIAPINSQGLGIQ